MELATPSRTFDICIIGHVTRDRIEIAGEPPRIQPGGTAYYAGAAARTLGLRTAVVTRLHPADRLLLADLDALGVTLRCLPSPATTQFVNRYRGPHHDAREQKVLAIAAPFTPDDFDLDATVYLLGPLTRREITLDCVRHLAARDATVALDVQGLLRDVRDEDVVLTAGTDMRPWLAYVDVVKAGVVEARRMTGCPDAASAARALAAAGAREVVVTLGSRGAHVLTEGRPVAIPAVPPAQVVDTTGCGDTFFAAYLARRLAGASVEAAGHFAATAASRKIARHGALLQPPHDTTFGINSA